MADVHLAVVLRLFLVALMSRKPSVPTCTDALDGVSANVLAELLLQNFTGAVFTPFTSV